MTMSTPVKIILGIVALLIGLPILAFLGLLGHVLKTQHAYESMPDTHDLKSRVQKLADDYLKTRTNSGLVIAVYQRGTNYVQGFGRISATNSSPPDAHTMFEIGSITKVFTAVT